jgi:hypothetical protein
MVDIQKNKMDKHLLAENPMRASQGGLAIIRTVQPISIYEVIEGHVNVKGISKRYEYNEEEYTLRCHHYFSTDIDTVDETEVYKFMDDAWFWFMAYMKWEDGL